ncbi:hypothetical protein [Pseudodonghicola flavimaris]|uniref:Uncharacterized protein n=1 Tax=Pseudodonghicola flavimaris TaxID=3050036 RepID=A0ABT7EZ38_9RHOB|nr:hypothetical protein [Pseudodonghicola flavimaris]MDK3017610.1 hypothetical protein [Pseudodonghicola flavimaris]
MNVVEFPGQLPRFCEVIAALRDGLGVEDMQAQGTAPAGFARAVVAELRCAGTLDRALGVTS